jgi:hypothetical protein
MRTVKIPYSNFFPLIIISVLIISFLWHLKDISKLILPESTLRNFGVTLFSLLVIFIVLVYKIMLFALKKSSAVILNQTGIIDNTRGILTNWTDIKAIYLEGGKTSSNLILELLDKKEITIYLSIVKGSSKEIYDVVQSYFDDVNKIN